jgi:hypothetical protein
MESGTQNGPGQPPKQRLAGMARTVSAKGSTTVFTQPCQQRKQKVQRSATHQPIQKFGFPIPSLSLPFPTHNGNGLLPQKALLLHAQLSVFPHACARERVSARRADPTASTLLQPGLLFCLRNGETSLCRLDAINRFCILRPSGVPAEYLLQLLRTASPFCLRRLRPATPPGGASVPIRLRPPALFVSRITIDSTLRHIFAGAESSNIV